MIQAILAGILIVWTWFLPETPRWLVKNGFVNEELGALADLHGTGDINDPKITKNFGQIKAAVGGTHG